MIVLSFFLASFFSGVCSQAFVTIEGMAQGTTYSIKYVQSGTSIEKKEIDSIFDMIDGSLSLYRPNSLISQFNRTGRVLMDQHMKRVVEASMGVYRESGGAFDITSASISALWGFGPSGQKKVPSKREIRRGLSLTGSDKLQIRGDSLIALKPGIKIDCNGIAQGYSVDMIASYLSSKGIGQMLVELGGEIYVKGDHPETGDWKIGVESIEAVAGEWRPVDRIIKLRNKAITTSGNYRNYFVKGSKSYTHVIDPAIGKPVDNGVITVTVIAATAMVADAWDNALFVMGADRAAKFLNARKDLQVYIIYKGQDHLIREMPINTN
jgi:thiamine biosynthesis lipoprotein